MQYGPAWLFDDTPIPDPKGHGERAIEFLSILKHPKSCADGGALLLDPWQQRIIRKVYGPCDENGRRICRVVYLQVGRGNRKSSLAAAMVILSTFGPERVPYGQVLSAAADRKQARIPYEEAVGIISATPQLSAVAQVQDFKNRIRHPKSGAVYEAISADAATNFGRTPQVAHVDELWAHRRVDLWHSIRTGVTKVAGSLLIVTTTAGRGTTTPDYPIFQYAKKCADDPEFDPSFVPIIFEADPTSDWQNEDIWYATNPGLRFGYPDIAGLRQLAREAKERPADREAFCQFHLGVRQEHSVSPFVEMSVYDEGSAPIDMEALRGRKCFLAGDMSATTDMSAVVAAFPDDDDGVTVLAWFFLPKEGLQARADRDGLPYVQWVRDGFITATQGNAIDYRAIEAKIREVHELFDVQEDAFDRAYAQPVMGPLLDDGFPVVTLQQGWLTQSPALNLLEGVIVNRKFWHGGKLSELIPVLSRSFDVRDFPKKTVAVYARHLRLAKLLSTGGRGLGGAEMTSSDCTNMILAMCSGLPAKDAAEAVATYREVMPNYVEWQRDEDAPRVAWLDDLGGVPLANVIERLIVAAMMGELEELGRRAMKETGLGNWYVLVKINSPKPGGEVLIGAGAPILGGPLRQHNKIIASTSYSEPAKHFAGPDIDDPDFWEKVGSQHRGWNSDRVRTEIIGRGMIQAIGDLLAGKTK